MIEGLDKPNILWYNKYSSNNADEKCRALRCGCGKLIAFRRDGDVYIKCRGCGHEVKLNLIQDQKSRRTP